jgi:hypothetical protein
VLRDFYLLPDALELLPPSPVISKREKEKRNSAKVGEQNSVLEKGELNAPKKIEGRKKESKAKQPQLA